jgi:hypothetical protein
VKYGHPIEWLETFVDRFRGVGNTTPIALDGAWYFASKTKGYHPEHNFGYGKKHQNSVPTENENCCMANTTLAFLIGDMLNRYTFV